MKLPHVMHLPAYDGGSIVNLMASIIAARGGAASIYPPLPALDPSTLGDTTNLLLIVIDGLGYEYLTRAHGGSTLRRHLKARLTSVFPSTTATAVTTFLTGTAPQQHALTGWFTYFKEIDTVAVVLPFQDRLNGTALSKRGITPAALFKHEPVFDRLQTRSYVVAPQRIAYSDFNTAESGAAEIRPYRSLRDFFKTIGTVIRTNRQPKYVYAYWPELDGLAHEHGIASPAAKAHLVELDDAFRYFLDEIEGTHSTIIVTADHGMIDSTPDTRIDVDEHPMLAQTLALPLCAESRAAFCYVQPTKRKQFETYVTDALAHCAVLLRSEVLIEEGYFGLGEPHPRLRERIGEYALIMKKNYTIRQWLPQEERYQPIGVHGGLSEEELYVPLIVVET